MALRTYSLRFVGLDKPDRTKPGTLAAFRGAAMVLSKIYDCPVAVIRPDGSEALRQDYWGKLRAYCRKVRLI